MEQLELPGIKGNYATRAWNYAKNNKVKSALIGLGMAALFPVTNEKAPSYEIKAARCYPTICMTLLESPKGYQQGFVFEKPESLTPESGDSLTTEIWLVRPLAVASLDEHVGIDFPIDYYSSFRVKVTKKTV